MKRNKRRQGVKHNERKGDKNKAGERRQIHIYISMYIYIYIFRHIYIYR